MNNGLLGASSLQKLRINFCLYKKELLQALVPALTSPALCPIYELDLAANAMNDEDAGEILSKIVILHCESRDETYWKYGLRDELPPYEAVVGIKKLDLSFNKLGRKTLLGIGTALKTDRYLLSLNLRSNLITVEQAKEFLTCLKTNNTLFNLDLRENEQLLPKFNRSLALKLLASYTKVGQLTPEVYW